MLKYLSLNKALGRSIGHIEQGAREWVAEFAGFQTQSGMLRVHASSRLCRDAVRRARRREAVFMRTPPTTAAISCICIGSAVDADPARLSRRRRHHGRTARTRGPPRIVSGSIGEAPGGHFPCIEQAMTGSRCRQICIRGRNCKGAAYQLLKDWFRAKLDLVTG